MHTAISTTTSATSAQSTTTSGHDRLSGGATNLPMAPRLPITETGQVTTAMNRSVTISQPQAQPSCPPESQENSEDVALREKRNTVLDKYRNMGQELPPRLRHLSQPQTDTAKKGSESSAESTRGSEPFNPISQLEPHEGAVGGTPSPFQTAPVQKKFDSHGVELNPRFNKTFKAATQPDRVLYHNRLDTFNRHVKEYAELEFESMANAGFYDTGFGFACFSCNLTSHKEFYPNPYDIHQEIITAHLRDENVDIEILPEDVQCEWAIAITNLKNKRSQDSTASPEEAMYLNTLSETKLLLRNDLLEKHGSSQKNHIDLMVDCLTTESILFDYQKILGKCCNTLKKYSGSTRNSPQNSPEETISPSTCPICLTKTVDTKFKPCNHLFCLSCADQTKSHNIKPGYTGLMEVECPLCRGHVTQWQKVTLERNVDGTPVLEDQNPVIKTERPCTKKDIEDTRRTTLAASIESERQAQGNDTLSVINKTKLAAMNRIASAASDASNAR